MSNVVDAVFTFSRSEYVRAMRRHYKTKLKVGRDAFAGVTAIAIGGYFVLSGSERSMAWFLIAAGAVLLLMVFYATYLLPHVIYRSQPKLKSEYRMQFRDSGIHFQTDEIDSDLKWSLYHSWLRDDEFYIMYHGKRDLSVIPRRALQGDSDQQFADMLERHIGTPMG